MYILYNYYWTNSYISSMFFHVLDVNVIIIQVTTFWNRQKMLCDHYARVFEHEEFRHPIGYKEYNWMADQYSGGCYAGVMGPKALTSCGR